MGGKIKGREESNNENRKHQQKSKSGAFDGNNDFQDQQRMYYCYY